VCSCFNLLIYQKEKKEKRNPMLIFLCFPSIIYLSMAVAKETEFEFWGFIFVMLAAVMSGFRWSMTQILLQVGLCLCF